jgi:hypothetical protein
MATLEPEDLMNMLECHKLRLDAADLASGDSGDHGDNQGDTTEDGGEADIPAPEGGDGGDSSPPVPSCSTTSPTTEIPCCDGYVEYEHRGTTDCIPDQAGLSRRRRLADPLPVRRILPTESPAERKNR